MQVRPYSESSKSKMVQRMVGPNAASANRFSEEVGISQASLSQWLRESGGRMGTVKLGPYPPDARRPEDWSAEERLRFVMEASRLRDEEFGAFLACKARAPFLSCSIRFSWSPQRPFDS